MEKMKIYTAWHRLFSHKTLKNLQGRREEIRVHFYQNSYVNEQFSAIHVDGAPGLLSENLLENLSELSGTKEEFILDPWKAFE